MNTKKYTATRQDIYEELGALIVDDLNALVGQRQTGHCIQVTDLPDDLMANICQGLSERTSGCVAKVVSNQPVHDWMITSTKLIELRNQGDQILIAFIPPSLRTSAEDSFAINNFERFSAAKSLSNLINALLDHVPSEHFELVDKVLKVADADEMSQALYLLAIERAGFDPASYGAALHHIGLVPDPCLHEVSEAEIPLRLDRNFRTVRALSNARMTVFEAAASVKLKQGSTVSALMRLMKDVGQRDPTRWLPKILDDSYIEELAFDQWEYAENLTGNIKRMEIVEVITTGKNDDGHPILDLDVADEIRVKWITDPIPKRCDGLKHFTIELTRDDVPVSPRKVVKAGTNLVAGRSGLLKELRSLDLPEGLYRVRLRAWAADEILLAEAMSETFWVDPGDGTGGEITEGVRAIPLVSSIPESKIRAFLQGKETGNLLSLNRFPAVSWYADEDGSTGSNDGVLRIDFGERVRFELPFSMVLRRVETETLEDVSGLGRYRLDMNTYQLNLRPLVFDETFPALERFIETRSALFNRMLGQRKDAVVETLHIMGMQDELKAYLRAYINLLNVSGGHGDLHWLDNIDTVCVPYDDGLEAYLMSPLHPMKLAWAAQFDLFGDEICEELSTSGDGPSRSGLADALSKLSSINLPYSILDDDGRILVNVENLGPYWSIFLSTEVADARAAVARIKSGLGASSDDPRVTTITAKDILKRVMRYIYQHPYVTTLVINAVQPGNAAILVQLLSDLQGKFPRMNFQVNLFSRDDKLDELGTAFDELMVMGRSQKGDSNKDDLLAASKNPLFPKLLYSKHRLSELISGKEHFDAHITMLFDVFGASMNMETPNDHARSNHVRGLVNEFSDRYSNIGGNTHWKRQIVPAAFDGMGEIEKTLAEAYGAYNHRLGRVVTAGSSGHVTPTICLELGADDKNLINQIHERSDWVFTIDRNFGLEYLDNPMDAQDPIYLIDQEPDQFSRSGHRFFISTHQIKELDRIVRPVLSSLELPSDHAQTESVLYAIHSVSSRLLLKLLSSPQAARGALGMGLARIFMEQASLLTDMILVPLDSHPEFFSRARSEAAQRGIELTLQRTDMLLVEVLPNNSLTFHLLEVKFRNGLSPAEWEDMQADIKKQLDASETALRMLFDPDLSIPDRVDREMLTHELGVVLRNYLGRALRYGVIPSNYERTLSEIINGLDFGYSLDFTQSGIIFSMGSSGYERSESQGVTFHLIGEDRVKEMLDMVTTAREKKTSLLSDTTYTDTRRYFTTRSIGEGLIGPGAPKQERPVQKKDAPSSQASAQSIDGPRSIEPDIKAMPASSEEIDAKIVIGSGEMTPQMGILGRIGDSKLALDLNTPNAISVFGVQGSGKSYTLGSIIEMSLMPIPKVNSLSKPLGVVVFHYSDVEDYAPEILTIVDPNNAPETQKLRDVYGAEPKGFQDIVLLVPEPKLEKRKQEYPNLDVRPILFSSKELDSDAWHYLMGVTSKDAMYVRRIGQMIEKLDRANKLTLGELWSSIVDGSLDHNQERRAKERLDFAKDYIRDGEDLGSVMTPGRLVVVDLRDKYISKDDALGMFMIIQRLFADIRSEGSAFNKLIVFDEAHNYMGTDFVEDILKGIRLMRHKGNSIVLASQDPESVPVKVIELSSIVILHKMSSPNWLRHIKKSLAALNDLQPGGLNMLRSGEAWIWANRSNRIQLQERANKAELRPRVTRHGGESRKAVG